MAQTPGSDLYSAIKEASQPTQELMFLLRTTLPRHWEPLLRCPKVQAASVGELIRVWETLPADLRDKSGT
jgi:hypothetical protein